MYIDFLHSVFLENGAAEAIVWRGLGISFRTLAETLRRWREALSEEAIPAHSVVSLEADFSPASIALLLALIEHGCTIVPLTAGGESHKRELRDLAQVEFEIRTSKEDSIATRRTGRRADHELLRELKRRRHPGLVLFSSGSTGKSKAAVHDFVPLLDKFHVRRKARRMAAFLLFDHIGGINTLFYALSNAGCLVVLDNRSPEDVCAAIEAHRIEVLPTSPTFLNLLLLSEAYKRRDLSSLELVTYGTEVMPESTLERLCDLFPGVAFQQTYGLSELGILRSKSKSSRSLWVKVGGEGYDTRVVDGMLEVKAKAAMLGYLNAPSPFTEDGWFKTGDAVEVEGDYIRILGRRSEIINVGGEKVHPAEVESVLQIMPGVEEAVVTGEQNAFMGQIVVARIRLTAPESPSDFRKRMHEFCRERLAKYKLPAKILIVQQPLHGERYKKVRAAAAESTVRIP
jgi:acyl-coenzyme A synthetase/AMP-(fatty) acid ligase